MKQDKDKLSRSSTQEWKSERKIKSSITADADSLGRRSSTLRLGVAKSVAALRAVTLGNNRAKGPLSLAGPHLISYRNG
jgi:hypothetical protein